MEREEYTAETYPSFGKQYNGEKRNYKFNQLEG